MIAAPAASDDLRLVEGAVPATLADPCRSTRHWQIGRDAFRMELPSGLAFHYRRGAGTVFTRPMGVSDAEVALFFHGSVRGAIAWIGGQMPLHASAVVHDGGVHAFTGVSGEGKSTLAAALADAGFPILCDDVLVVDPATAITMPGGGWLKLWGDALALTGRAALEPVRAGIDKYFVATRAAEGRSLPLRRLYVLESVTTHMPAVVPVAGHDRFVAVCDAQYRRGFGIASLDVEPWFAMTARMAGTVSVRRFRRSRDPARFAEGVATIAADLRAQ